MGRDQRIIDELRRFERLCLDLAGDSTMPEERAGLETMAGNYRAAIACYRHCYPKVFAEGRNRLRRTVVGGGE
jgi:hypothetical protein